MFKHRNLEQDGDMTAGPPPREVVRSNVFNQTYAALEETKAWGLGEPLQIVYKGKPVI